MYLENSVGTFFFSFPEQKSNEIHGNAFTCKIPINL